MTITFMVIISSEQLYTVWYKTVQSLTNLTRGETICFGPDTIRSMIHCTRYNTFHDTFFLFLAGKQRTTPHSTCFCLHSNHEQWVQQWRPRRSFQVQCFCVEFLHFIGIYWLLSVSICSFLTLARDRTVSYRISISLSVSRYVSSAQIYRCFGTMVNRFTPKSNALTLKVPQDVQGIWTAILNYVV